MEWFKGEIIRMVNACNDEHWLRVIYHYVRVIVRK